MSYMLECHDNRPCLDVIEGGYYVSLWHDRLSRRWYVTWINRHVLHTDNGSAWADSNLEANSGGA